MGNAVFISPTIGSWASLGFRASDFRFQGVGSGLIGFVRDSRRGSVYYLGSGFSGLEGLNLGFRMIEGFRWEFPKIGGTLFWGPYNKDPTI